MPDEGNITWLNPEDEIRWIKEVYRRRKQWELKSWWRRLLTYPGPIKLGTDEEIMERIRLLKQKGRP